MAFAPACYLSDATPGTFNCFYQKWEKACEDAVQIGKVSGNAPYDPGYKCEPVGNGDYTLQIGPDKSNIRIYLEPAPRQTPFIPVDGMAVEVSGPYRNLVDPKEVAPGNDFYRNSGIPNGSGGFLKQNDWSSLSTAKTMAERFAPTLRATCFLARRAVQICARNRSSSKIRLIPWEQCRTCTMSCP